MMKKLFSLLLVLTTVLLCISLFSACNADSGHSANNNEPLWANNENVSNAETEISKSDDTEYVKDAYESLNKALMLTSSAMDDIYRSWYFTIYHSGDYSPDGYYYGYIDFAYAEYMGREYDVVYDAFEKIYDKDCTSQWFYTAISKVSTGVPLIIQILKDESVYTDIEIEMEKARTALKNVNKDNDAYEDLMAYYTEMMSFQEFAESPTGSFSGLESTVSSYEKNIQEYKNRLSIYIE